MSDTWFSKLFGGKDAEKDRSMASSDRRDDRTFERTGDKVGQSAERAAQRFHDGAAATGKRIDETTESFMNRAGEVKDSARQSVREVEDKTSDSFNRAREAVSDSVHKVEEKTNEFWKSAGETVQKVQSGIPLRQEDAKSIADYRDEVNKNAEGNAQKMQEKATSWWKAGKEKAKPESEFAEDAVGQASNFGGRTPPAEKAEEWRKTAEIKGRQWGRAAEEKVDEARDTFSRKADEARNKAGEKADSWGKYTEDTANSFSRKADEARNKAGEKADSWGKYTEDTANRFSRKAEDVERKAGETADSWGKYAEDTAASIENGAKDLGRSAKEATRGLFWGSRKDGEVPQRYEDRSGRFSFADGNFAARYPPAEFFSNFSKEATDIIHKGYVTGQMISITKQTPYGVNLTTSGTTLGDTGNIIGLVNAVAVSNNLTAEIATGTHGQFQATATYENLYPGLVASLTGVYPDKNSAKAIIKYQHPHAALHGECGLHPNPLLELSATVGGFGGGYSLGAEVNYDYAMSNITKMNAGWYLGAKDMTASAIVGLKTNAQTMDLFFTHKVAPDLTFAVQATHDFGRSPNVLTHGVAFQPVPEILVKARYSNAGTFGALLQHEFLPKSTVTASVETELKAASKSSAPKFGIALSLFQ